MKIEVKRKVTSLGKSGKVVMVLPELKQFEGTEIVMEITIKKEIRTSLDGSIITKDVK